MPASPNDDDLPGLLAREKAGDNAPALSVGDLSSALKRTVEGAFSHARVRGEISGWKRAASGHCYFTLKDDAACIDAVLWKGQAGRLAFSPEDGAEVVATGKLTTYPGRSKYQVVVQSLELAGEGALMALLDKRRRALAAEGLFAPERKRQLPYLPRTIGVVTSPTGAVIRDILHRLADRAPSHVIVWPVQVQGESAAGAVAAAIRGFDALPEGGAVPRPDLLIVARGGGSIEDLWAFNEEAVVRAAADCSIPLISAVGHETDTTLIDHAADRRAPTPTAAAEMAVPVLADLRGWLDTLAERGAGGLSRLVDRMGERATSLAERLPSPARFLDDRARRTGELSERLKRGLNSRAADARGDLLGVSGRLDRGLLDRQLRSGADRLAALWRVAELAHPDRPLERGYARVTAGETLVTRAKGARGEAALTLHFSDGEVEVTPVTAAAGAGGRANSPVAKRARPAYRHPGQRGLFDPPGEEEER